MPPTQDSDRHQEPAAAPWTRDRATSLDVLPPAYRSWLPGLIRVGAALLLTAAGGLALRSLPDQGDGVASASPLRHGSATSSTPATAGPTARAAGPRVLGVPAFLAATSPTPDLHVLMVSPAGTRTVSAGQVLNLHADVSDGAGGNAAAVDVVWGVRSAATGQLVFAGHGTDVELPAGSLGVGGYRVSVRAFAGPVEARDEGGLDVVAGRS